jgi:hypothetical protein
MYGGIFTERMARVRLSNILAIRACRAALNVDGWVVVTELAHVGGCDCSLILFISQQRTHQRYLCIRRLRQVLLCLDRSRAHRVSKKLVAIRKIALQARHQYSLERSHERGP